MDFSEGYVKYLSIHADAPPLSEAFLAPVIAARTKLWDMGLVGMTPEGIGFGNLSQHNSMSKHGALTFVITGTATGGERELGPEGWTQIESADIDSNMVTDSGPVAASAETLSHAAVYRACPAARFVIHIHSAPIFEGMLRDGCPATPPEAEYGTPELARAVERLVRNLSQAKGNPSHGAIVLAGHQDGVIVWGATLEEAMAEAEELAEKYREKS
jgi:ribulose-5-phosphate 4-epimerase/fuculose-1-phosphate aldolase